MDNIVLNIATLRGGLPVFTLPAITPYQRKVYGGTYIPKASLWAYPAFYPFHTRVINDLWKILPNMQIPEAVKEHIESENKVPSKVESMDMGGYEPLVPFYPHQKEAFCRALHHYRYGLFLGRGLGKTKIIVDLVRHLKTVEPDTMCLILALRVNLYTWKNEALFHSKGEVTAEPLIASSPKQREKRLREILENRPDILVCTYDTARVAHEIIRKEVPYTVIVADESHRLRGYKSQQTQAAHYLAAKARRRILLTGTASLGDPRHLWGQLKFLGKFVVPSHWDFTNKYVVRSPYNKHIITGFKNMHLLNKEVANLSMTLEAEDCLDMPPRVFQDILVDPTPALKKAYNALAKNGVATIAGVCVEAQERIVSLGKLAQLSSGFVYKSNKDPKICDGCPYLEDCVKNQIRPYTRNCKVDTVDPGKTILNIPGKNPVIEALKELLEDHLIEDKKVIVWAKHVEMLNKVFEASQQVVTKFHKKGKVLRYDSSVEDLSGVELQFNTDTEAKVLVAQISMGIAVTFKAPIMIYAELDWSSDTWLQSQDRNYGIRAKGFSNLLVQVIAIKGTVADATRQLLKNKVDVASLMTRAPECVTCERAISCLAENVKPYDPKCKYSKTTKKTVIRTPCI